MNTPVFDRGRSLFSHMKESLSDDLEKCLLCIAGVEDLSAFPKMSMGVFLTETLNRLFWSSCLREL